MNLDSLAVNANLNLFLSKTFKGIHSRNLCGPCDGLGAFVSYYLTQIPPSLPKSQCFGAFILFKCFFGPLFDLN